MIITEQRNHITQAARIKVNRNLNIEEVLQRRIHRRGKFSHLESTNLKHTDINPNQIAVVRLPLKVIREVKENHLIKLRKEAVRQKRAADREAILHQKLAAVQDQAAVQDLVAHIHDQVHLGHHVQAEQEAAAAIAEGAAVEVKAVEAGAKDKIEKL